MSQGPYPLLEESAQNLALNAKDQLNFYQIFWCDLNVANDENQTYIKGFKTLGFLNVQQFDTKEKLLEKLDMRKTQKTIILLSSGGLMRDLSRDI